MFKLNRFSKTLLLGLLIALFVIIQLQLDLNNYLPITLARLDSNNIVFECLNFNKCPENIQLDDVEQSIVYIDSAFYQNPDKIVLVMRSSDEAIIVMEVNLKSNQKIYTVVPNATVPPLMVAHTDTQLVIGDKTGQLFFIQDGILSNQVKLLADNNTNIANLFIKNKSVVVLNSDPINQDNKAYAQVWLIDMDKASVSSQLLPMPKFSYLEAGEVTRNGIKYAGRLVNVSEDLTKLYFLYYLGANEGLAQLTLGMFDVNTLEEKSVSDTKCINLMTGYSQYNGIMYSNRNDLEGNANATFVSMQNLTSIADMSAFVQNELTTKLVIKPFYQNFLFGTNSRIFVVMPSGEIVKEYSIPLAWNNQNYILIAYHGK